MKGYFIYCRKSSEASDRQIPTIESQVAELKEVASLLNLPVVDILKETQSATKPGRPIFNEMLERLERGEARGIICWKLDLLAFNAFDGIKILLAIEDRDLRLVTPTRTFSRRGDNMIVICLGFGIVQKYVGNLSNNVKRGLKVRNEQGWYPGLAPLGYLNCEDKQTASRRITSDPERFTLVRRMWDLMLTGRHSLEQIVKIANTKWGLRTRADGKRNSGALSSTSLYKLFTNPFYYGSYEYPKCSGHIYKGRHEAMISTQEYDRVQVLLGRNSVPGENGKGEGKASADFQQLSA